MATEDQINSLSIVNIEKMLENSIDKIRYRFGSEAARNPAIVLEYVRLVAYEKRTLVMREIGLSDGGE